MAMTDLIIPSYKNKKGLYETLMSIGLTENVNVIIVDDCSGEDYSDIIEIFSHFFTIRVFKTSKNGGPGIARQFGLDHSFNEYVVFIDCGDVFTSPGSLKMMIEEMDAHPEFNFISFAHHEERNDGVHYTPPVHNRIHGKIYRRNFLSKYNIRFNTDTPRANEDIGFNMNCRLIISQLEKDNPGDVFAGHSDIASVIWRNSLNSITRQNDCAFYYKEQNQGLAHGAGFAITNALNHGVSEEICDDLRHDVLCALYFFYISTLNRRPEFAEESLDGCYYFYKNFIKPQGALDMDLLKHYYFNNLIDVLEDGDPYRDAINPLTIHNFIMMLDEQCEKELNQC